MRYRGRWRSVWIACVLTSGLYAQSPSFRNDSALQFDKKEPICVATTDQWAPFNHSQNGKLVGIGIDYWNEIKRKLGLKDRIVRYETWQGVLDAIRTGRCDLTIATQETPERCKYAVFSDAYADYPIVIVTRSDVGFIDDLPLIADKTIVLPRAYATSDTIVRHYPQLTIRYVENIDEALRMVSQKKAFATVGVLPVVSYKMTRSYDNLKISGKTPYRFYMKMMLSKRKAALLPAINAAIASIDEATRRRIYTKWIVLDESLWTRYKRYWIGLIVILGAMAAYVLFYIVRLKYQIRLKEEAKRRLETEANYDFLTQAYSRRHWAKSFERFLERHRYERDESKSLSLVLFDIDLFKEINDNYGHHIGDKVLKRFVENVQRTIRPGDLFGRLGGDEFALVLPGATHLQAREVVRRIAHTIRKDRFLETVRFYWSFGIASYRQGDDKPSMMERADKRLYRLKRCNHYRLALQKEDMWKIAERKIKLRHYQ